MTARDELADDLMVHVYYDGREGSALTDAQRDDAGYTDCQRQADVLLAAGWRKTPSFSLPNVFTDDHDKYTIHWEETGGGLRLVVTPITEDKE
jgi:hypothetical protein